MQGEMHFPYPYNYQLQAFTMYMCIYIYMYKNFFPSPWRTLSYMQISLAPPSINQSMWTPHNLLSIPYTSFRGLKTFKARTSGRLKDVIISMHLYTKNWKYLQYSQYEQCYQNMAAILKSANKSVLAVMQNKNPYNIHVPGAYSVIHHILSIYVPAYTDYQYL